VANSADDLPNQERQVVELERREIRRLQLPTAHHSPNQNIVARQNDGQAKSQMRRKVRQDRFRRRIASEDLSVSGSARRLLLAQAAENVISCSMELGGNAPFIVLADADLDAALEGALVAKMRNTGQSCIAANRFYVEAPVAEKFSGLLARAMGEMPVGSGLEPNFKVGPVINDPARQKMLGLVQEAAGHGARVLTGGKAPNRPGYFVPPTVLTEVPPDEHILKEEIFGPIAPVVTFRDVNEAIAFANRTDRGLASYVYTRDLAKGLAVAEAIESGMVGLNRGFISDPAAPFGGVKQSGVGREGSHDGLLEFLETKYIATNW